MVLEDLRVGFDADRGDVHALPATGNAPSYGICTTLGFRLAGDRDVDFAGRVVHGDHWVFPTP
ncbi:hypothetical protein [Streptomyces sp. MMG1121]|uniref:hypothetical protein n=1 Tax=Streptomyces sp. MMG1121 TaxID=1415544 RepID=UPI0006AEF3CD|nr:hypothetical protein [Streptomyces sp. MMG1121]